MNPLITVLLVFTAGGTGTLARYAMVLAARRIAPDFPLGTLVVNAAGCLTIGLLAPLLFLPNSPLPERWRVVVLIGFLGGFTTFSSFAYDTLALGESGRWLAAGANLVLNNGLGLALVWIGVTIARTWLFRSPE